MLKSQDCILLIKLLANPNRDWSQRQLAKELFISLAEVNYGIKRLEGALLLRKDQSRPVESKSIEKKNMNLKGIPGIEFEFAIEKSIDNEKEKFQYIPILSAATEFLIHGIKYLFPGKLGEFTRGIPTAYGAPIYSDKIVLGNDPIPVWPYARGTVRGVALEPIHSSVPQSLDISADVHFYELLVLIDAIRVGRARERNMAVEMLEGKLKDGIKSPHKNS